MDRLSIVSLRRHMVVMAAVCLGASGCGDEKTSQTEVAPRRRVVAVKAKDEAPVRPDDVCDVMPSSSPLLSLPKVDEKTNAKALSGRTWLNVWATWCKPCIEELPMLVAWQSRLEQEGVDVSLRFLSADASNEDVALFLKKKPVTLAPLHSQRVAEPEALPAWLQSVGLDRGAPLPIHVLTNSSNKVICARAGAVDEEDYEPIKRLLQQ